MELKTFQEYEEELATLTDPDERRRMRGKIRRLKRKAGVTPSRVLGRSRSRDPYANEQPEDSMERLRAALLAEGLKEHIILGNWIAYPVAVDPLAVLTKSRTLYGVEPRAFYFLPSLDDQPPFLLIA